MVALLVAGLIPAAAFTMYQIVRITADKQSGVEAATRERADDILGLANARLSADLSILQTLAQSTTLDNGNFSEFREITRRIRDQTRGWVQVVVVDPASDQQMMNLLRPAADLRQPAVVDASYRRVKERLEPAFGGTILSIEGIGEPVVPVRAPVLRDGRLRYVLSVGVQARIFQDILESRLPDKFTGAAAIVDPQGNFIARVPDPGQWIGKAATEYVRNAIAGGRSGVYLGRTHEGLENYTVFNTSPFTGWSAHIALDAATFDTPRSRAQMLATLAGLACLALGGVLIVLVSQERAEQRRAAAQLQQMQRLEALGKMTGGIAHDFNNLLAIIIGNIEMMRRRASDRLPPQIDRIAQAAERGEKLVRQMLAFARRQPLQPQVIDPNAHIRSMSDLLRRALRGDISLDLDLPAGVWPIEVDPVQFERALLNLVINARDAMPGGGTLRIAARNVPSQGSHPADLVEISVTDTGTGIPTENLAKVFDPFFTTKAPGEGTGLGLSMVHGFAGQSGGRAEIDSEVGRGTRVRLLLPRATRATEAADAPAQVETGDRGHGSILVVEDNAELRDMTVMLLEDLGYTVRQAGSPAEALSVLERFAADLVFSDVLMPGGINGIDFAREARRRHPGLEVLLATGDAGALSAAERSEFTILQKPYRIETLADAIRAALDRSTGYAARRAAT